ncbi:uncharacterized protein MCYG_01478 [Microsporum canis CBS 113480]|uniref:Uncharacterized protein n=1 Tax=Arthroderma otae (strain ATCC MYA-4605 / CBS 113480) TaxID=554155 RepID=C5FH29_ARTOC|nr:uncharacterized protein MCYG_01478 [Microsporum canis CBS 113480]EEQ28659.1 predicted protein [Microsporum canis CBS 113480]
MSPSRLLPILSLREDYPKPVAHIRRVESCGQMGLINTNRGINQDLIWENTPDRWCHLADLFAPNVGLNSCEKYSSGYQSVRVKGKVLASINSEIQLVYLTLSVAICVLVAS